MCFINKWALTQVLLVDPRENKKDGSEGITKGQPHNTRGRGGIHVLGSSNTTCSHFGRILVWHF
ncbi:hypothetical protein MtrunA17_Chr6g0478951 [Medicago truncatula]|uniref:Uncharacterized protein n=1 Tax=Medicago truncatula TaxID=3880 RepID=A0A396HI73_MEDTR|nr:hypothetical protein MtrunA17_Chr6g0478951 [Medicago truncatula]